MPPNLKWFPKIDFSETNGLSAFFHLLAATLAISSLISNEWIIVNSDVVNGTRWDESPAELIFHLTSRTDQCQTIGCRDFWKPVRFGGFLDQHGKTHIAFHSEGKVALDCVNPLVANLFYVLMALCSVLAASSIFSCLINLLPPPHPFLQWIRRNTILEMSNMVITLFCCIIAIIAQAEVDSLRPKDEVSLGSGVFFICFAGLLSFAAAASHLRHIARKNRERRLDNQRLLCARSLRSWRDVGRNREDQLPIVDFERYLDSATSMSDLSTNQLQLP